MPHPGVFADRLKSLSQWTTVSYKKNILRGLERAIQPGETILDLLEGFAGFSGGAETENRAGVLFLTDRRLFFLTGESVRPKAFELAFDGSRAVRMSRGFSSFLLRFPDSGGGFDLKTFSRKPAIESFLSKLRETRGGAPALLMDPEIGTERMLDRLPRRMRDADEPPAWGKGITPEDLIDYLPDWNRLHEEARVIVRGLQTALSELTAAGASRTLKNDLLLLASICMRSDGIVSEKERLLASLVMMSLFPGGSEEDVEAAGTLFEMDAFPLHLKERLDRFWASQVPMPENRPGPGGPVSLSALPLLRAADRKKGTVLFDGAAAAYIRYCRSLIHADGPPGDRDKETLREIHAFIFRAREDDAAGTAPAESDSAREETLEDVLAELDELIGMDNIKKQIRTFVNLVKVRKARREHGLPVTPLSLHAVFFGPPGTGKTTIARILGKIYRCLGLLAKGHLVETDRAGMVAGYVGQTAIRVDEQVAKALDGVLFVDEAYALTRSEAGRDFGMEAVDTLLKRMEDQRERLAVITAGYTDEMRVFIGSNPGLKSRFSRYFYFDHFSPEQLTAIFLAFTKKSTLRLTASARKKLLELFTELHAERDRAFGNGRLSRNIFEQAVERQADRIAGQSSLDEKTLCTITRSDIPDREDLADSPGR